MTFVAQHRAGSVSSLSVLPVNLRIENALISYVRYMAKAFWPSGLAVFYQFDAAILSATAVVFSALLLIIITVASVLMRPRRYLIVGWLWFVGMLVPAIGLVQVGKQAMADRYMYLPLIGLSTMVAWGTTDLLERKISKSLLVLVALIPLIACARITLIQVGYWKNSEVLFRHALAVTGDENAVAHENLGTALATRGDYRDAIIEFSQVARLAPDDAGVQRNLSRAYAELGNDDAAIAHLSESLRLKEAALGSSPPDPAQAWLLAFDHNLLGRMMLSHGRRERAIAHLSRAVELQPANVKYAADLAAAR